ncbi:PQQ-binding-like beta-propeller repeat protein [Haloplanus halobius]|uniref:outer membrane protein assembly factor BamB family protein n=1 Tax=Haloplanus halobius TaxID=2934938 RepID=UPI00200FC2F6|nr:PQQ-binding-like beta-propeller repeat protein [Haloplanus sp. XH21]
MAPRSRREVLHAGAAVGTVAIAGCLDRDGTAHDSAQRQAESPIRPSRGTWPTAGRDPRNTRHSPSASPPRADPTTAWSVSLSGVASAVVVGPDHVYASSDAETVAIAPDGTEQWRVGVGGGLSYIDQRLYISAADLVALDTASGQEQWRSLTEDASPRAVHETSGTVYVTSRTAVHGLQPDSGAQRWRIETARYPGLVADTDRIALVTNEQVQLVAPGETVDGLLRDPAPRTTETIQPGWRPGVQSCTLLDEALFVTQYGDRLADADAAVRRYGLRTTDERWMTPLTWAGVGSVAVDDDHVYAAPFRATTDPPDGSLVALDRRRGTERWRYDGAMLGAPAVGGDTVVAGGADPGSPSVCVSSTDDDADTECSPGDSPADTGVLHAFDTETGDRLWTIRPGGSYGGYPLALVDDRLYYGDETGIHALV